MVVCKRGLRRRSTRLLAWTGILLVVLMGGVDQARAQSCVVTLPIGTANDLGTAVAVQFDGKILLAGYAFVGASDDFTLVRFNPDMSLDLSFGTNGIVTTDFFGAQDRAEAIAVQPDGKILLAGHATNGNRDLAVARYALDGSLDATFGTGGKVTTALPGATTDELEGVAVQSDGMIVVAGHTQRATLDFVVARYDTSGSLDTAGFNAPNGYFISTNGLTNDSATSIAVQPSDGKIVLGGWASNGANDDFSAARFNTNGTLDGGFGGGGTVLVPVGTGRDQSYAMTIQSDGKILLAGSARNGWDTFALVRLSGVDGSLDTATFNPAGTYGDFPNAAGMVTSLFTGVHDVAFGVVEQTDNKIVLGGYANWDGASTNVDFALARYASDGNPDATFGTGGDVMQDIAANNDWIDSIALQTNGKIVAGGYTANGTDNDFALGRFNADGSLDCPAGCAPLSASASGGTITVTASGQFELRFNEITGGAVDQFYDLSIDSSRSWDLAGGLSNTEGFPNAVLRAGGIWHGITQNENGARLYLLEATPTRVRVRQNPFYEEEEGAAILGGVLGEGDFSIYPAGKMAWHWTQRGTDNVAYTEADFNLSVRNQAAGPFSTWDPNSETGNTFTNPGTDDFTLLKNEDPQIKTDFLNIMYRDWTTANGYLESADALFHVANPTQERRHLEWREQTGATITPGLSEEWSFLTYFKPTSLGNAASPWLDPEVIGRRDDFRNPDALSVTVGSPWIDASEKTSAGDDFNESESAYALTFDPALGLTFDIDGGAPVRYAPFFKIRQWRSLQGPTVTLEASPIYPGEDFRADVKPLSRAHWSGNLILHTTFENGGAVTAPDVGSAGAVAGTTTFALARPGSGNGALFDAAGEQVTFPGTGNLVVGSGAAEFWFQPRTAHTDGVTRRYFSYREDPTHQFRFEKTSGNNLRFILNDGSGSTEVIVAPTAYSWRAFDWVHLRITWDTFSPLGNQARIYVNGVEPAHTDPVSAYDGSAMAGGGTIYVGSAFGGADNASGIIDELRVYTNGGAPQLLASGGLSSLPSEFLATTGRNFTLSFDPLDASGRGEYFYLGADSTFRGVNVFLATLGVAAAVDLQWEYWNGTGWADLESGFGFTDETNHFTTHGTVYWTGDPFNWAPYSVDGGPDLYYVRVYLASGSYTTKPIEGLIKTDILLFQYCGDISLAAQTFAFALPTPTSVELESFVARGTGDGIELRWRTSNELNNLGFHVYRSSGGASAFERLTASPIPGLGSSPVGAAYRFLDRDAVPGVTYDYVLEDIETTGRTERHGPVSASLDASESVSSFGEEEEGDDDDAQAEIRYGDPEATAFRILRRSKRHLVVELRTEGFIAQPTLDGSVEIRASGLEEAQGEGAGIPVMRMWLDLPSEGEARVGSIRASRVEVFESLRPAEGSRFEVVARRNGTVRARRRRGRGAYRVEGLFPAEPGRVVIDGFQGPSRKVLLELAPIRWDADQGTLVLARRLVVRVDLEPAHARPHRRSRKVGGVLVRLATVDAGLYAVGFDDLFSRRRARRPVQKLRLSRRGSPVAYHIEPDARRFGPGSTMYFYSPGADANPYGNAAVFELELGVAGSAMEVGSASPFGASLGHYWQRDRYERNRYYQAGLVQASDPWYWEVVLAPASASFAFDVSELAPVAESAELRVWLQGASDLPLAEDHHVVARVNGTAVGAIRWNGKAGRRLDAELWPGLLHDGENYLEVTNVGDTGASYSMVFVDRFEIRYPRRAVAGNEAFQGEWTASGTAEIEGLSDASAVLDISGLRPKWLRGFTRTASGVRLGVNESTEYLAVAAAKRPELRWASSASLGWSQSADWIVIGPRAFLPATEPLRALREAQGLRTKAVAVEDVFDRFGHGERDPLAVREFLRFAYHEASRPPRYVVLVGDGNYDFKNYLETGSANPMPPFMVKTSFLWTASDPSLAAVNGDDPLPDIAIGRLPAASLAELDRMVEKILAHEASPGRPSDSIVFIADNPDAAGDFDGHVAELARGRDVTRVLLSELGVAETRTRVIEAFDGGSSLMSYVGHGGIHLWAAENVFDASNVAALAPGARQPLLLTMNCLNGFFHFPYFDSLSEELLKADEKGIVAAFSPTGLSLDAPAHVFHRAFLDELTSGERKRLGDAVLAAQQTYARTGAFPELVSIYHLFGDPALSLR